MITLGILICVTVSCKIWRVKRETMEPSLIWYSSIKPAAKLDQFVNNITWTLWMVDIAGTHHRVQIWQFQKSFHVSSHPRNFSCKIFLALEIFYQFFIHNLASTHLASVMRHGRNTGGLDFRRSFLYLLHGHFVLLPSSKVFSRWEKLSISQQPSLSSSLPHYSSEE